MKPTRLHFGSGQYQPGTTTQKTCPNCNLTYEIEFTETFPYKGSPPMLKLTFTNITKRRD
jgi:hypothetical protein